MSVLLVLKLVLIYAITIEKAGRFEKMLHFDSSHPIVTRDFRVSRAPQYHTFPAFLNINGR